MLFVRYNQKYEGQSAEGGIMFSEIKWLNVIQWAISILTVAVGIWQFSTQQRQANSTPFLQKQLELAFQSSETASILATETNMEKWEQARQRFWVLYWGIILYVADFMG